MCKSALDARLLKENAAEGQSPAEQRLRALRHCGKAGMSVSGHTPRSERLCESPNNFTNVTTGGILRHERDCNCDETNTRLSMNVKTQEQVLTECLFYPVT